VTGTINFGGESITHGIMTKLKVSKQEASKLKGEYGLDAGKNQSEILSAISTDLKFLTSEIQKIIRYFEERSKDQSVKVKQIIILGDGANLPGFTNSLTSQLR